MKKRIVILALALVSLVVALAACESSTTQGHHWPRASGAETVVHVALPDWADRVEVPVRTGITRWSVSPELDVRIVRACPPEPTNCVVFKPSVDMPSPNVGLAQIAASGLHIVSAWIQFDSVCLANCATVTLENLGCHEFGHTLGLGHGTTQGPCVDGVPTDWDLGLILDTYHLDGSSATFTSAEPTAKVMAD